MPFFGAKNYRRAVMVAVELCPGGLCYDSETFQVAVVFGCTALPQSRKHHWLAIFGGEEPWLFSPASVGAFAQPFIPAISDDEAAALSVSLTICWGVGHRFSARIEGGGFPILQIAFVKPGNQPPTGVPYPRNVAVNSYNRRMLGGPHLFARFKIECWLNWRAEKPRKRSVKFGPRLR